MSVNFHTCLIDYVYAEVEMLRQLMKYTWRFCILKMYKLRGKTELTVIGIVVIVALILYILSSNDVLVESSLKREKSIKEEKLSRPVDKAELNLILITPETAKPKIHENSIPKQALAHPNQENRPVIWNILESQKNSLTFHGHRIVHLDLKGAPPRVAYYDELFPLLQSFGATGILLEYEDMFPYSGVLKDLAAYNAYSKSDIKHILKLASKNKLEVIPLIQTFGHLEYVLKLEKFAHLREVPKYPQVLCPSNNDTFTLLKAMVNQIMELHPHIKHLHIGCDEVFNLGNCIRCGMTMVDNKWTKSQLFLNHVIRVAKYILKHYPNVMPLIWDDEFRKLSEAEIHESGLSQWIEPVIWHYTPELITSIGPDIWEKYISIFPAVWVASAFKGATGADSYVTDISYHLENHRVWMDVINSYSRRLKFRGIVLTGWQRYDHFSVLCELLPVGLPSLATNLYYVQNSDKDTSQVLRHVMELLKCDPPLPLQPGMGLSHCSFPGGGVLDAAERFYLLRKKIDHQLSSSYFKGWLTSYNIENSFSSPQMVELATAELDHYKMELNNIKMDMITSMTEVFDSYTVNEWIDTYIQPVDIKLQNLWDVKEKLLAQNYWSRRPLDISRYSDKNSPKTQKRGNL